MIIIYQKNKLLLLIFLLLATLSASVTAQREPRVNCLSDGNYTSNSTYQANLRTLLSNLSANVDDTGFYNTSVGQNTNRVNGAVLCRADVQLDICRICIQNATVFIVQGCPNQRQAILYDRECMLRYSNAPFIGTMDTQPVEYWNNVENTTRYDEFMNDLLALVVNITNQASNSRPPRKVGYGSNPSFNFQTIYSLAQCTPDLSVEDCSLCLTIGAQAFPRQFYGMLGARFLQPSCNLRYEVYRFYNETRLGELLSPPTLPPVSSPTLPSGTRNTTRTIIIIVSSLSTVVGTIILILIGFLKWRMHQKKLSNEAAEMDDISVIESLQYEFSVIQAATNDFDEANKLGEGGFGAVYKGRLANGREIAVKRLSIGSAQGDQEFKNEVVLLAKLQHRNLVRLFGFSLQGQEKLLIYEFVQNGSLDQLLFDPVRCSQLDWTIRYKIIGGILRGILYMHEDSRVRIIHRDLKASNVLLDGEMNPKIADFGMARLFVQDQTEFTSRIVGTYGYMAPEYATRGQFSVKSDVFSFGVLLLEIISGLKNNCSRNVDISEDLISSAWGNWHTGTTTNLVDPVLRVGSGIPRDILRCIHIGLLCVQESAAQRPTMATIVTMLTNYSITLPVPSPPTLSFVHDVYNSTEESSSIRVNNGRDEFKDSISQNEMSISEFYPR